MATLIGCTLLEETTRVVVLYILLAELSREIMSQRCQYSASLYYKDTGNKPMYCTPVNYAAAVTWFSTHWHIKLTYSFSLVFEFTIKNRLKPADIGDLSSCESVFFYATASMAETIYLARDFKVRMNMDQEREYDTVKSGSGINIQKGELFSLQYTMGYVQTRESRQCSLSDASFASH